MPLAVGLRLHHRDELSTRSIEVLGFGEARRSLAGFAFPRTVGQSVDNSRSRVRRRAADVLHGFDAPLVPRAAERSPIINSAKAMMGVER